MYIQINKVPGKENLDESKKEVYFPKKMFPRDQDCCDPLK